MFLYLCLSLALVANVHVYASETYYYIYKAAEKNVELKFISGSFQSNSDKFRSHADDIDIHLLNFFNDKSGGSFVDLCATEWSDPSNSFVVETFNQWHGVCVVTESTKISSFASHRKCTVFGDNIDENQSEAGSPFLLDKDPIQTFFRAANVSERSDFLSIGGRCDRTDAFILQNIDLARFGFLIIYIEKPTVEGYYLLQEKKHGYKLLYDLGDKGCFYIHKSKDNYAALFTKYRTDDTPHWLRDHLHHAKSNHSVSPVHYLPMYHTPTNMSSFPSRNSITDYKQVVFYTHLYSQVQLDNRQVFIFTLSDLDESLGNSLGFLFEAMGCAWAAKADFSWLRAETSGTSTELMRFMSTWPVYYQHPENEHDPEMALVRIKHHCPCFYYCWEFTHAAWSKVKDFISPFWHRHMAHYAHEVPLRIGEKEEILLQVTDNTTNRYSNNASIFFPLSYFDPHLSSLPTTSSTNTTTTTTTIATTATTSTTTTTTITIQQTYPQRFPLIPDVTLHLRCSDIITNNNKKIHTHYGFLPFHHYSSRIPPTARTVYVLSDPIGRGNDTEICGAILASFVRFLRMKLSPDVSILVKRGGEVMFALAQITLSANSVCSASTFCFWAAVGSNSTVSYPASPLIHAGKELFISNAFHWISDPHLLHFTSADSVEKITAALYG